LLKHSYVFRLSLPFRIADILLVLEILNKIICIKINILVAKLPVKAKFDGITIEFGMEAPHA